MTLVRQVNKNVMVAIERNATTRPDAPALEYASRRYSYDQLLIEVHELAAALASRGIGRDSIIFMLGFNTDGFVKLWMAASHLGALFTPINYRLAPPEVAHMLKAAHPSIAFVDDDLEELLRSAMEVDDSNFDVVVLDDGVIDRTWLADSETVSVPPMAKVDDAFPHRLVFTSGTTGYPKGAILSHGNLVAKSMMHSRELEYTPNDGTLVCGPMYHVGAFDSTATTLFHVGGFVALHRRFDAEQAITRLSRGDISAIWLAPAMIQAILRAPSSRSSDLSAVRVIISGGEKIPEPLIAEFAEVFPNAWFADAYGLTESVSAVAFLERRQTLAKLGSVGRPIAYAEVRIADEAGEEVPSGEVGEILVRSEAVFQGYWHDESATRATLRDGWLHTEDLGYRDKDGYLYVVDRLKDMIRTGSENVASLEVERVLYEHESVESVAVIGVPDPKWREVPWAFVIIKNAVTAEQLVEFCADRLAKYKIPKGITFVDDLPRNPSGKVLKRVLREQVVANSGVITQANDRSKQPVDR